MKGVFEKYCRELNAEQKKAVDTIDGPVMVIAGPGTGKTQILTLRIANILKRTDTSPDSILALTFTDSGAYSMKKRLSEIIGSAAHRVEINTFHGFANKVIGDHPESFPRIIGSRNISAIEQIKIMEKIIFSSILSHLKPYGDNSYYVRPTLDMVRNLKRENISPKELKKIVERQKKEFSSVKDLKHKKGPHEGKIQGKYQKLDKYIKKNKELSALYEKYEKRLAKGRLYDYEDMIMEVVRAFENDKDLLLEIQEKYQYVLADEHQDSNRGQNRLLELLADFHENPNLFIVGDEKQAIFRFQGASLENFRYFRKLYPKAELITLKNNYRSTQSILDNAGKLLPSELKAKAGHKEEKVSLFSFSSPKEECAFLARDAKKRQGEVAILYRDNKDAFPIAEALERAGAPFVIESDQDILSDPEVGKMILLLRAVNDLGDEELKSRVLFIDFLGLNPLDVYGYFKKGKSKKVEKFNKKLIRWNTLGHNQNLVEFFGVLVEESGFMNHIIFSPNSFNLLSKVERLFDEIKNVSQGHRIYKLGDFIDYLDVVNNYNVLIRLNQKEDHSKIRLMTAHRSKGLEFDYVYVAGLSDGHWGNKRDLRHFHLPVAQLSSLGGDPNEDERRLFYVALTRARKGVILSYSTAGEDGKLRLPSLFLNELDLKEKKVSPAKSPVEFMRKEKKTDEGLKNKEYLNELWRERELSVTALNNYLECPWKYFFQNLLRLPALPTKQQMYGTAVHNALRDFFRLPKGGGKEKLLKFFEGHLKAQFLDKEQFRELSEKGRKTLSGYCGRHEWRKPLAVELKISGVKMAPGISLSGVLDKLEPSDGNSVNVVDYKTGKSKSRNWIEGKTKDSNGDYKRQLVFYKLLLHSHGKYKMKTGELDFVEPPYKKERFEITEGETDELKKLIGKVSREILDLDFWDKTCGEKNCKYCALRRVMHK